MLHPAYVPPPAPAAAAARSASPPRRSQSPPPPTSAAVRRALPDRVVTAATIDDAFVSFILYCNPGVPVYANTASLRENFQAPPKSGGKTFSTYNLYELIRKLDTKELKTWAELALKLGVDPPDPEKGESSQKIQQYAVRLKVTSAHFPSPGRRYGGLPKALPPVRGALTVQAAKLGSRGGCIRCTLMPSLTISSNDPRRTGRTSPPSQIPSTSRSETAWPPKMTWLCEPSCLS